MVLDSKSVASFLSSILISSLRFFLNKDTIACVHPSHPYFLVILIPGFDCPHHHCQHQHQQDRKNESSEVSRSILLN